MIKLPFIGTYLSFFLNPIRYFERVFKQQGNVAIVDFGLLGKTFFIFDPDDIEQFFSLGKRMHRQQFNEWFGNGLFTLATGTQASEQRNVLKKCFTTSLLEHMISIIEKRAHDLLLTCSSQKDGIYLPDIIKPFVKKLQIALVVGEVSASEEDMFLTHLDVIIRYLNREFTSLIKIPSHWPTPANRQFKKSLSALKSLIKNKVTSYLANANQTQDLGILPALVEMMRASSDSLSHSLICEEILSLLIAGTETSGAILIWMLHLLAISPETQKELKNEANTLADQKGVKLHDLIKLPFSKCVVQETLRLYPPAWAIIRNFATGLKTKTYDIPDGATVWAVSYITHRHPDFWEQPEKFLPERFVKQEMRAKFAFFPFAGGNHRCLAERFVMTQAQLIAVLIGRNYDLTTSISEKLKAKARIALTPITAPTVIITKREALPG